MIRGYEEVDYHLNSLSVSKGSQYFQYKKVIQSQTIDVSFKSRCYQQEKSRMKAKEEMEENSPQWELKR
jgi:hypothetical protein